MITPPPFATLGNSGLSTTKLRVNAFGRFDAETYAAVAEAEADEVGGSLDAAAVASSRRGSGQQHHQCRGRRCRRRQKKKHESA